MPQFLSNGFDLNKAKDAEALSDAIRRRTPLHHDKVPFVICWSQKSGCTSVLKWFLYHAGLLQEAMAYREGGPLLELDIHTYENRVFKARKGYRKELIQKLSDPELHAVYFMRCPYERAFSSYMQIHNPDFVRQFQQGKSSPGLSTRQEALDFTYGEGTPLEYPLSFRDYLLWVIAQDHRAIDPHHASQITDLFDLVDIEIFKLTQFDTVIGKLEKRYGLTDSAEDPDLSPSGHHVPKQIVPIDVTLKLLEAGIPLNRSPQLIIPEVTKSTLMGTVLQELIEKAFPSDVARYKAIPDQAC